jgi:hypothetical protein
MHTLTTRLKLTADDVAGAGASAAEAASGNGTQTVSVQSAEDRSTVLPAHLPAKESPSATSQTAIETSPSESHVSDESHREGMDESQKESMVQEHDIVALLRAANRKAGPAGCSAIADILSRAGILPTDDCAVQDAHPKQSKGQDLGSGHSEAHADDSEAAAAEPCEPKASDGVRTHIRQQSLQAIDCGQPCVVDHKAGCIIHSPSVDLCMQQCQSPEGGGSPECHCLACTCTLMPSSPQPERPPPLDVQEIGLKCRAIFSWRLAMRANSVQQVPTCHASNLCKKSARGADWAEAYIKSLVQARMRKAVVAVKLVEKRLPILATLFARWRNVANETVYRR